MFNAKFIKSKENFIKTESIAPIFRRKFTLKSFADAKLKVCGLGFGYFYLNGKIITEDLFTAPVSTYENLVWYNVYDVTELLKEGENVLAVILGNNFFNENFDSHWHNNNASFRDNPKLALELIVDGETFLSSDESFKTLSNSFVIYNELRSGETFNAQLYDENWKTLNFDDSKWGNAVFDNSGFCPERKECLCPPIREIQELEYQKVIKVDKGYVLDFGVNISGYMKIYFNGKEGQEIKLSHSEEIYENGELKLNGLNILYTTVDFQVDRYICGKKNYVWSPKFTYHGFRYVLVEGLEEIPKKSDFKAVFVHQLIERNTTFECDNELFNKIYNAGIRSSYSNMHYALTDCPTREKFGWMNDAQASAEQLCINFKMNGFFEKWVQDIFYSMREDGAIPAVVPSFGYGFNHGPVADGALFEIPYKMYLYYGNKEFLIKSLPYFEKYFDYFISDKSDTKYWLGDWDGFNNRLVDTVFIREFYVQKFSHIINLACKLKTGKDSEKYLKYYGLSRKNLLKNYIVDGKCILNEQTPVAMLITLKLTDNKELSKQLITLIEKAGCRFACGMLGYQYIFDALTVVNQTEYIYKSLTSSGIPSYKEWFSNGATTLWETWKDSGFTDSRNHHMYSEVIGWFIKGLLGVNINEENIAYENLNLTPNFIKELNSVKGKVETGYGVIGISWERKEDKIYYTVKVPNGLSVYYNSQKLTSGENTFIIKD